MSTSKKSKKDLSNFGIPNLYYVILICTIMAYIIRYAAPDLYMKLVLIPYMVVVEHEFWRLFTWIFTVPYELGGSFLMILFLPINMFFYYSLGRRLEMLWGRFMYNLYVIGGCLLIDISVVIGAIIKYYVLPNPSIGPDDISGCLNVTWLMFISIFLAFTVVGGDNIVYMYFVIPLKMKWMGYIDLAYLIYIFIVGGYFTRIIVVASVANYFIYFLINKGKTAPSISDMKRKRKFQKATQMKRRSSHPDVKYNSDGTIKFPDKSGIIPPGYGNPKGITIHKCAVCGRTEQDDPNLEFRFCSKCDGNYEYCSEHIFTHQHIHS
ncbi:MAG: rhomboid family intramembrane serine protease [Eubacterium sp.]|nr:rhomboid family intramembrane serine protease [Eubacterium sp.]